MVCQSIGVDPHKGISLDGLRLVYASGGANVEDDYYKVFPKKSKLERKKEDDGVIEVGENGGVDISSG